MRRIVMIWPAVDDERCEALFASGLPRSEALTADSVEQAISRALLRFGARGCTGRMAQEFGDHPHEAAERMRWVRQLAIAMTAQPTREPRPQAA
jgi:hypothetical protein